MLSLHEIEVHYGDVPAVAGVSIHVRAGDAVAVVGESGAGKSTLSRVILALERPSAGVYEFEGRDLLSMSHKELRRWRRSVQAVFQNPASSLDPRMKIRDLVTEAVHVHDGLGRKERAALAHELLNQVGLQESLAHRYPHQLSGGQNQRVAIARAISVKPRLLVLDEPVSGLDVSVRARVLNLLASIIRDRGMTVVYITHDLATVAHLCDRLYVMYRGLVVEEMAAERLQEEADHPYSQLLVNSILSVDEDSDLEGENETRGSGRPLGGGGCPFVDRCQYSAPQCETELPELHQIRPGHWSRCHFAGQQKVTTDLSREPAGGEPSSN